MGDESQTSGSMGTVACDVESRHLLFLGRKEVKRRRKEVVVPPLTSATVWEVQDLERGCLPEIKSNTHPVAPITEFNPLSWAEDPSTQHHLFFRGQWI